LQKPLEGGKVNGKESIVWPDSFGTWGIAFIFFLYLNKPHNPNNSTNPIDD